MRSAVRRRRVLWLVIDRESWPASTELDADTPIDLLPVVTAPAALVDAELADWRDHAAAILTPDATTLPPHCRTCQVLDSVPALEDALWRAAVRDLRSTR